MHIYRGFANGLENLNKQVVSDRLVATPVGRAYKAGEDGAYVKMIHFEMVDESNTGHLNLEREFSSDPARYGGGVYMGAAGLLNLGYIAAARPAAVVLFDVNAAQTVFWKDVIKALAENPKVEGFIDFLVAEGQKLPEQLRDAFNSAAAPKISVLAGKYRRIAAGANPRGWLQEGRERALADRYWIQKGYRHLHLLAKNGAIGAVTLDVLDTKACAQLKDYLDSVKYRPVPVAAAEAEGTSLWRRFRAACSRHSERQGAHVDMLYVSNIFDFLGGDKDFTGRPSEGAGPQDARANLEMLLNPEGATVIHSSKGTVKNAWPALARAY